MSTIPNQTLRWAGIWNETQQYIYAEVVIDSSNEKCYVNIRSVGSTTGGDPPSTNTEDWLLLPTSTGGGVNSVTSGSGSGITVSPTTDNVVLASALVAGDGITLSPSVSTTEITISAASAVCGIYTESRVTPTSEVTIPIPGLTVAGIVITNLVSATEITNVIPNTTFFFDLSTSADPPPGSGNLLLDVNTLTQTTIVATELAPITDVLMGTFLTPLGFMTSLGIAGGNWIISLFASTTDITEVNTAYIKINSVDADGTSNPTLIYDGNANSFIINNPTVYNYNSTFIIPTTILTDLTRRVQIQLYASFGIASSMTFYFRDTTISNITTTISQHSIVPKQLLSNTPSTDSLALSYSVPISVGDKVIWLVGTL